jgi:hypothetical protein
LTLSIDKAVLPTWLTCSPSGSTLAALGADIVEPPKRVPTGTNMRWHRTVRLSARRAPRVIRLTVHAVRHTSGRA